MVTDLLFPVSHDVPSVCIIKLDGSEDFRMFTSKKFTSAINTLKLCVCAVCLASLGSNTKTVAMETNPVASYFTF